MSSNAQALLACPVCGGRRLAPLRAYRRDHLARCRACRRGGRILDVGCGIGFFLEEPRNASWEAHGTEFEQRAVEIVRAKGLGCAQAPIGPDAFEPGSFDVVTAFEVVEHVGEPRAEAAAIAAALRPGGLPYLTTPNFGSLSRRLRRALPSPSASGGAGACRSDERLREQIEGSRALGAAKRAVEVALGATRTGDTIKGRFELRREPHSLVG